MNIYVFWILFLGLWAIVPLMIIKGRTDETQKVKTEPEVKAKKNVQKEIIRFIKPRIGKSGIIYCLSRKKVEEIAQLLQVNGGWNSGSFDMRVSAPNGNLSIDLKFQSYYSSSNVASWFCIYTCFV